MGLALTALWKVPPIPPLQLENPSLKPQPSLPVPLPHPPPLALFAMLREGAAQAGLGEGPLGGGGRASKRHLGPDPHLGALDLRRRGKQVPLGNGRGTVGKCTGPKWSKMVQTTILVKIGRAPEYRTKGRSRY